MQRHPACRVCPAGGSCGPRRAQDCRPRRKVRPEAYWRPRCGRRYTSSRRASMWM